jgi:hypothetical protein
VPGFGWRARGWQVTKELPVLKNVQAKTIFLRMAMSMLVREYMNDKVTPIGKMTSRYRRTT